MRLKALSILSLSVLLLSCGRKVEQTSSLSPFVQRIISNPLCSEMEVLKTNRSVNRHSDIFILGDSTDCKTLSSCFLSYDEHDNGDGKLLSDLLPDFAGEVISSIYDNTNPYAVSGDIVVSDALLSLDTICHVSPYDRIGRTTKQRAKLLVLASPSFSYFGHSALDTLFKVSSCGVNIIDPYVSAINYLLDEHEGEIMIGVIACPEDSSSSLYSDILSRCALERGRRGCKCIVASADTSLGQDPLIHFLDSYIASGLNKPLDAIVFDDFSIVSKDYSNTFERVTSPLNEESLTYIHLFSKDFELLDVSSFALSQSYDALRREGLFSNRISFPSEKAYELVPHPDNGINMIIEYSE